MYSKAENIERRKRFWTAFGRYMTQHMSMFGPKHKWLNYKTGIKDLYFRLQTHRKSVSVSIELQQKDDGVRELLFQQWEEVKSWLHSATGTEWTWEPEFWLENGRCISRIYVEKPGLKQSREDDWGEIFEFFAHFLVALDEIWVDVKPMFEDLVE